MKRTLLLLPLIFSACFIQAQVQKLSFDEIEETLSRPLIQAEESLFLKGYSFIGNDTLNNGTILHTFSTRGKTVKTAKALSKAVYKDPVEAGYVQYVTYEAGEFQSLRKLMLEKQFTRIDADNISENSSYFKDNLEVKFMTDDSETNKAFVITFKNRGSGIIKKPVKKLSLKSLLKQD